MRTDIRPRAYAAAIMDDQMALCLVPEHLQALTRTHIDIHHQQYEFHVQRVLDGPTRDDRIKRLSQCPKGMRSSVEAEVRVRWQAKQEIQPQSEAP